MVKTEIITGDVARAAEIIRGGGLVAVPTETVYGLAGNAMDAGAVEQIYEVKGRPTVKPLSLMVPDESALDRWCRDVPPAAYALARKFWPGPLTIILKSKKLEPEIVRAGGDTIGLRCPDHPLTLALLRDAGVPLAAPSANPSGSPSPKRAEEVTAYFNGKINAILDGGECGVGRESTILDMSRIPYRILRQGALPEAEIGAALRDSLTLVGITGGSGCGKTTALSVLEDMGALVLDADRIYHDLTASDKRLRAELTERFGAVYEGGKLNRRALAEIVFANPSALAELNELTHKYVLAEIDRRLTEHALNGGTLAAVDAVALIECGLGKRTSFNVAVTAPEEARIERIALRDGISREAARARIAAQKSDEWYECSCGHVLRNDGDRDAFKQKCTDFFTEVLRNV
ncbi:MAG: threonylcarbamoyl-AMP synthase [Oscillospiraceae bacterium]|nr:threonylcarbamoyl-AMP synthase [Oscillospiraceae bacterium]